MHDRSGAPHTKSAGRRELLRFFVLFALLFVGLQRLYLASHSRTDRLLNHHLNAVVSAAVVDVLAPGDRVSAVDARLISASGMVDIRKGCEGFEVVVILVAGMLAYPMPWRHKLMGVLSGTLIIYVLNLVRIVLLYFILTRRPQWFDTAHVGVGQTIMILLAVMFFMFWIDRAPRLRPAPG